MYILEARMIGKDKYSRLTKEKLMERKYTYDGLREGDTYEFRVIAVNEVGPSKPSFCTKPITCKDELGEDSYWNQCPADSQNSSLLTMLHKCLLTGSTHWAPASLSASRFPISSCRAANHRAGLQGQDHHPCR